MPPVVGILAGLAVLYGAWLLEPRWIKGALGLIVLYVLLTNTDRAAQLFGDIPRAAGAAIKPRQAAPG